MSRRELPPPPLIAPTPSKTLPPWLPSMMIDVADAADAGIGTAAAIPPTSNADRDRQVRRHMETSVKEIEASRDRDPPARAVGRPARCAYAVATPGRSRAGAARHRRRPVGRRGQRAGTVLVGAPDATVGTAGTGRRADDRRRADACRRAAARGDDR